MSFAPRLCVALIVLPLVRAPACVASAQDQQEQETVQVLDVMRVRADQPAEQAVLTLTLPDQPEEMSCDVVVAGASTGGVAAAIAVAEDGHSVCITEETNWIGGQMTAQGVSALDENDYIERGGATASYQKLRDGIRRYYAQHYRLSSTGARQKLFNPGSCWVSALCFEPEAALEVLGGMLKPHRANRFLKTFLRTKAISAEKDGNRIVSVLTYGFESHRWIEIRARYFLDASDLGELLPITGAEYLTGAEPASLTGEPHASPGGDPNDFQSFTYPFVVAREPGGQDHRLGQPPEYEAHRSGQPYSLIIDYGGGKTLAYRMFEKAPQTPGSFWAYRRLLAAENFAGPKAPREVSMINWPGNDYCGPGLLSNSPFEQAQALREAKMTSLGFAFWLQTEAPRDDGGKGYPDLQVMGSKLASSDGLAQFPYIRESRRIRAVRTIKEQDISARDQKGARAALFPDSVGIGFYPIDIHSCSRRDLSSATKPFQVPLGALVPQRVENLIPASKNIGTTHITNGAYRLHPVEWGIGEAAGTLAGFAIDHSVTPLETAANPVLIRQLQAKLLERGVPLFWFDDLKPSDPGFLDAQMLAVLGIFGPNNVNLHFAAKRSLKVGEAVDALARVLGLDNGQPGKAGNPPAAKVTRHSLTALTMLGYLPETPALSRDLDRELMWSDLELASSKSGVEAPFDRGALRPASRAGFAVWLAQVYRKAVTSDRR